VVRTTYEALAAVLGGTQSLHTNALDEALGLPTEASARLALRTQQILAEESGVPSTVDPLAGAYEIEYLTDRIEKEGREYLDRIESMGGALIAVEKGYFQGEIAREAYRVARDLEAKREIVVGVNDFATAGDGFSLFEGRRGKGARFQRISSAQEREQIASLNRWRRKRDAAAVESSLHALRSETRAGRNVMPSVLRAVTAGVTLGEISGLWRDEFGEYRPQRTF
ncbi:MAG TPA: methylmalonyl-CoA mutase family protein, partial [Thermoplasmata archaeon]|nr:methylmalonyl-CoA mutase family protein [Thermoplasmata archaeon]